MRPGALLIVLAACHASANTVGDAGVDGTGSPGTATITATVNRTRFVTREHMLAAGEMQISGEPLAEQMGRDLTAYSRDRLPTDLYHSIPLNTTWIDLPGFSTGVESYEYSKQPMNELAFESGAGTSLVYAPLVDFDAATGTAARAHLAALVQHFAAGAHTLGRFVFAAGTYPVGNASGNANPTGAGDPTANELGWPGIWPTTHVFASFDPAIDPTGDVALQCAITSDDDPDGMIGSTLVSGDYECDASTLHLRSRATQIDATITPGADGFSAWKYGLWVLNYLQIMHDVNEAPVATVDAGCIWPASARRVIRSSATTAAATRPRRGHVPRIERHRGFPGADVHHRARQSRRRLARELRDYGRRDARGLPDAAVRPRLRLRGTARVVPSCDRRDRDR